MFVLAFLGGGQIDYLPLYPVDPTADIVEGATATGGLTNTTQQQILGAPSSGTHHLQLIVVTNESQTVGTVVEFRNGSTRRFGHYAGPGGGFVISAPPNCPIARITAALNVACLTTGAAVHVSVTAVRNPV